MLPDRKTPFRARPHRHEPKAGFGPASQKEGSAHPQVLSSSGLVTAAVTPPSLLPPSRSPYLRDPPVGHRAVTPLGNLTLGCAQAGWQQVQQPQAVSLNTKIVTHTITTGKRIPLSTNSHRQSQSTFPSTRGSEYFPFLTVRVSQEGTGEVAGSG